MFCFILLQHLFHCNFGFMCNKMKINIATILQAFAGLLQNTPTGYYFIARATT